ncbi:PAS domain S-box protein [candidate division KSB1 bacterium]|nr:PAS domain S-box protein [candidate division KSB1 bacterium]NIR68582.1 PAS domain S-box protein [candidate division KSB1 bacterium]NIS25419.1 PAS domain S-box protein [candidate division KSB1 bacterium]NIT72311.1 PAS domain S-box protein [candidate division KSB1 bacterium]NIU26095.1 PAS domain S-box protein [candidate division KSB1 bacterium]
MSANQIDFEDLITSVSTSFVNLAAKDIESGIHHTLQEIGEFVEADRSYVVRFSDDGTTMSNTHEWCREGVEPQIQNLKHLPSDSFPWWMGRMRRFETIQIPDVAELSPEAAAEREILQMQDVKSLIVVPMIFGGSLVGFLGFDAVRARKTWAEESIKVLKIVGEIFVNALERQKAETACVNQQRKYENLVNSVEGIVWELDADTFQFTFVSKQTEKILGYPIQRWLSEPGFWQDHIHPEDRDWVVAYCKQRSQQKKPYRFEYRMVAADGRTIWLRDNVTVVEEDDRHVKLQGVMVDVTEQKTAEEALKESEEKYQLLVENSGIPITILDADARISLINNIGAENLISTSEQLVGKTLYDILPKQQAELFHKRFHEVVKSGKRREFEDCIQIRNEKRWFWSLIHPIKNTDDKVIGVQVVSHDITERKQAETDLQNSELRYRTLAENTPVGIWQVTPDRKTMYVNDAMCRMLEIDGPHELHVKTYHDFFTSESLGVISQQIEKRQRGETSSYEVELITKKGRRRNVVIYGAPLFSAGGELEALIGTVMDITERKQAEETLRESETRLRLMTRQIPAVLWTTDKLLRFTSSVGAGLSDLKLKPSQVVGQSLFDFFRTRDLDYLPISAHRQAVNGDAVNYELEWKGRTYHSHIEPLRNAKNEIVGTIGLAHDITKRKQAEQQLRNLSVYLQTVREEERTRISREIHDELGQALTGLKMDLAWLKSHLPSEKLVQERTTAMSAIIDETIASMRRIASDLRPSVLDDLGLTAAIEWQAQEFEKRTGIKCRVSSHPSEIALDSRRSTTIFRMFQESLTNAARHSKASQVEVRLNKQPNAITLRVQDNGRGIKEDEINGSKSLGLVGIRERAYSWGGKVEISGKPGKGTNVTVTIPHKDDN